MGRLRDVVRQTLVTSQLAELVPDVSDGPLRVIDIGCGQGTQALALARAGCRVTGLDRSTDLLDRFRSALAAEPLAVRAAGEQRPAPAGGGPPSLTCWCRR